MAKIWRVYDGREPTRGGPWAELPIAEAAPLLDLGLDDFVSEYEITPRFGQLDRTQFSGGYKNIVVEVDPSEAKRNKPWKAGFYRSELRPREAFRRLVESEFKFVIGEENLSRVEYEDAVDHSGNEAIRLTVVLSPGAIQKMPESAALNALVAVRRRLLDLGDDRVPMIEYATQAELEQDDHPEP